ncbi:hypothetical protein D918_07486 [Trichuris suis]|nr:hypothetical protein D918_07486 [Trichuris suis]
MKYAFGQCAGSALFIVSSSIAFGMGLACLKPKVPLCRMSESIRIHRASGRGFPFLVIRSDVAVVVVTWAFSCQESVGLTSLLDSNRRAVEKQFLFFVNFSGQDRHVVQRCWSFNDAVTRLPPFTLCGCRKKKLLRRLAPRNRCSLSNSGGRSRYRPSLHQSLSVGCAHLSGRSIFFLQARFLLYIVVMLPMYRFLTQDPNLVSHWVKYCLFGS